MKPFDTLKSVLTACLLLILPLKASAQSGIFLRGEVNNWSAVSDWEFTDQGNGTYSLSDKTLTGNFKIADANWSANCNYGSNGSAILMNTPYQLSGGSNPGNISCGSNTFFCKRIILTIVSPTSAILTMESDNDGSHLEQVYVIGDNNGWNYNDTSGMLKLADATDSTFVGRVTLPAATGNSLARWTIFQQTGMGGAWGLSSDATEPTTSGRLTKGLTGKAAVAPGTYNISFSTRTGNYSMELIPSVATAMTIQPERVTLVPQLPDSVNILSLNNSLIYFARQDTVFNHIAKAMGRAAHWTTHSNIGKTLDFQWKETDATASNEEGQPSAQTMIQTGAWTHIILQEQTERPRKDFALFKESLTRWVRFIRENCPNPHAVIIVPVNWPLRGDFATYPQLSHQLDENYRKAAQELGVVLAPVGTAYNLCYEREGSAELSTWFRPASENNGMEDDRHPSAKATYMAACVEYATIFGEDPLAITYTPASLTQSEATSMKQYAHDAWAGFTQTIDHHKGTVQFASRIYDQFGMEMQLSTPNAWDVQDGQIDNFGLYTASGILGNYEVRAANGSFSAMGTVTVAQAQTTPTALPAVVIGNSQLGFSESFDLRVEQSSTTLPTGWRIDRQIAAPRTVGLFATASDTTMYAQTETAVNLPANAKNGTWSFGIDNDRALGGISTGVSNATRCVNVYVHLKNEGTTTLEHMTLAYDVEKYRAGSNPAGFHVQLYYSADGSQWTSAGPDFNTYFAADAATTGYDIIPGATVSVSCELPTTIAAGASLYLAWNISVATGTTCNAAQALAIDNVSLKATSTAIEDAGTHTTATSAPTTAYNLLGQKLSHADPAALARSGYRGIAIIGGRKVIIR